MVQHELRGNGFSPFSGVYSSFPRPSPMSAA